MHTSPTADRANCEPPSSGQFAWKSLAIWVPVCLISGAAVAGPAVVAEEKFAPFLIFPVLVGVGLGAVIVGLMRVTQVGHRRTVLLGTVLAAAVTIVGQHYHRFRAEQKRITQKAEEFQNIQSLYPSLTEGPGPRPPANLWVYLRAEAQTGRNMMIRGYYARGWVAWASWTLDGLLVLAATLAMVVPAMRQPFCNRCGTWYRTIRSGRIDAKTAARLAEFGGLHLDNEPGTDRSKSATDAQRGKPHTARYRLLACNRGCGPTGLDLSWQRSDGVVSSDLAWLDAECRDRIMRALDETDTPPAETSPDDNRPRTPND